MKTKKLVIKSKITQQILWFIGLYLISIIGLGLFHELSKWFIDWIK